MKNIITLLFDFQSWMRRNINSRWWRFKHYLNVRWGYVVFFFENSKIFLKFWQIPIALNYYQDATNFLRGYIDEQRDEIDSYISTRDYLFEEIADLRVHFENLSSQDATRKTYAEHTGYDDEWQYNENLKLRDADNIDEFVNLCPTKYLTEDEFNYMTDRDMDNMVTRCPIANQTLEDLAYYNLGKLEDRGLYEFKKY